LKGLTILAMYKNIKLDPEEIIDCLAKKPRKLEFVL